MIVHSKESEKPTSLIDLLGGKTKTKGAHSNDVFAKLLSTLANTSKGESKTTPLVSDAFKTVIDPKKNPSVNATELQALLNTQENSDESAFVSKELLSSLSDDQVRTLIYRAKEHLKSQIAAKSPEYQQESKSFPKTLAGLVQLADKLGLDPQSITLSTLEGDTPEQTPIEPELLSKPFLDAKILAKLPSETQKADGFEAITQLLSERKSVTPKPSIPAETSLDKPGSDDNTPSPVPLKASLTPAVAENTSELPVSLKAPLQKAAQTEGTPELSALQGALSKPATERNAPESEKQPLKNLLQTLEKRDLSAEAVRSDSAVLGETKPASASSTAKADTLIALLQGELPTKETKSETAETGKSEGITPKSVHVPAADSFEVKTKEAQQGMRLFATDLKEAVENYKPPFTRLTMKLNPEKLGEVEVTLVQRGNNVHVNIQSNNANSVAFLAHNATELKAQLAHQGITNATMNFMAGGEGSAQQQQQQQNNHNRFRSYESFQELEMNEEQLSALEIIIPHYA